MTYNPRVARITAITAMTAMNSTLVPAVGLWFCHGPWDLTDYSLDEERADWPDSVICRDSPPRPVVAWRVADVTDEYGDRHWAPNIVLPTGEFEIGPEDRAFGTTPQEAIAAARAILAELRAANPFDEQQAA